MQTSSSRVIITYLFLPGMRFALIGIKTLLAKVILNFEIVPCEQTQVKMEILI